MQQGKDDITALFNIVCPVSPIVRRMKPSAFIDTYLCRAVEPHLRQADHPDDYMRSLLTAVAHNEEQNTDANRGNQEYHYTLAQATGRLMQVGKYRTAFENVAHSLNMRTRDPREDMERIKRSKRIPNDVLLQRISEIGIALHIAANDGVKIRIAKENIPFLYDFQVLASLYRRSSGVSHRGVVPKPEQF